MTLTADIQLARRRTTSLINYTCISSASHCIESCVCFRSMLRSSFGSIRFVHNGGMYFVQRSTQHSCFSVGPGLPASGIRVNNSEATP